MLRTNYFHDPRNDGQPPIISFKFDSKRSRDAGAPAIREIFVYCARCRGRASARRPVARGGCDGRTGRRISAPKCWASPRRRGEERGHRAGRRQGRLRAEAAAAGRPRATQIQAEGVRVYKTFVSSLLDLTDNLEAARSCRPAHGVATTTTIPIWWSPPTRARRPFPTSPTQFRPSTASGSTMPSPRAARPATTTRRWASPRGARGKRSSATSAKWTSTSSRRPSPSSGVGDMSGDVFGNGMLLSQQIRLIAAFDHRDIFIDPDPDPAACFAERQRLFDLPRSCWQDYDKSLFSQGRRHFSRQLKSIALVDRDAGADSASTSDAPTPQRTHAARILTAPVDLLWFGGIGTYVKASTETHADAGDRANDAIRVNGTELAPRWSAKAPISASPSAGASNSRSPAGGINTDAIDNSAGVNSSDIEVNIKIALGLAGAARASSSREDRNAFLAAMTDEVAASCCATTICSRCACRLRSSKVRRNWASRCSSCAGWNSGRARPQARIPSRRYSRHRARYKGRRDDPPRIRGADGLCENLAEPGGSWRAECPTILICARIKRYFPKAMQDRLRGRNRIASVATRDHRDGARQQHDQSRRPEPDGADDR